MTQNSSRKYFFLFIVIFLFGSYAPKETKEEKDKILLSVILHSLSSSHYLSKDLNDDLSKKIFDEYLKMIDVNKKFFIKEDIEQLKKYHTQLDDQAKVGTFEFFELSQSLLKKRIQQTEEFYKEILSKPMDFKIEESIETNPDKLNFANNPAELKENWRKLMKYIVMSRLQDMNLAQEKAIEKKDTAVKVKTFDALEQDAREKVLKNQNESFKRLNQLGRTDWLSMYINAIIAMYDPHTNFFPPKEKENFDIALSGQFEGIGATLQERDGFIKVAQIVPGSASWRQGQLKANDVILKVAQANQEAVDIVDMRLDDAVKLIRGKKGTEVRLTVKKIDGTIIIIPIIRDVVVLEETYAKSVLIKGEKNIGYIKLPQFYADFNGKGGRSCASDVKAEIEKLKKDKIEGIILDLRNNGGGSLQDAVEMGGLFIDKGPIVQVKTAKEAAQVLNDYDPAVQYDGPLVILVNELSASASEILAAAMQDYGRAIILGANTFGKGTVQRIIDLDSYMPPSFNNLKPFGAIKMTTQKFYRINGGATQLKGVSPDILLPDNYKYLKTGERELDYPIAWDEIPKANYKILSNLNQLETLKKESVLRIKSNKSFSLIDENAKRLKVLSDRTLFSLNFQKYNIEQKKLQEEAKKFEDIFVEIKDITILPPSSDATAIASDTAKAENLKVWTKSIQKDMYIYEGINVIKDLK
ncbi:MAG: tail-specific protease [Cytophagales bacterium]|nr:MAG: tail-specific protease [Cytophagales bacterium]